MSASNSATNPPAPVSVKRLRGARTRAADNYDAAAWLEREVAERLLERLDYVKVDPARVLDIFAATGHCARALQARYPQAQVIALDLAQPLLAQISAGHSGAPITALCANPILLPLADASVGVIFSNAALHWFELQSVLREVRRVLEPGGLFLFSSFGPDTLKELRAAFAGLDEHSHVMRFIDMHDIGDALLHGGLSEPVLAMDTLTVTYAKLAQLTDDLRALGARNLTPRRPRTLYGKNKWLSVVERYEARRAEGVLPATFEIVYGSAWKPLRDVDRTEDGSQIIEFHPRRR